MGEGISSLTLCVTHVDLNNNLCVLICRSENGLHVKSKNSIPGHMSLENRINRVKAKVPCSHASPDNSRITINHLGPDLEAGPSGSDHGAHFLVCIHTPGALAKPQHDKVTKKHTHTPVPPGSLSRS